MEGWRFEARGGTLTLAEFLSAAHSAGIASGAESIASPLMRGVRRDPGGLFAIESSVEGREANGVLGFGPRSGSPAAAAATGNAGDGVS